MCYTLHPQITFYELNGKKYGIYIEYNDYYKKSIKHIANYINNKEFGFIYLEEEKARPIEYSIGEGSKVKTI